MTIVVGGLYRKTQLIEVIDHLANEVIVCNENRLSDSWGMSIETFMETYEPAVPVSGAELFKDVEFDFGVAIRLLKEGHKVARKGWNGKGMFLIYIDPYHNDQFQVIEKPYMVGTLTSWIGMKTADNKLVPWLASQTDVLAEDWTVL